MTKAEEYYNHGICTFPVGDDKLPYKRASWKDRQTELLPPIKTDAPALAIVCGAGSGNLQAVDIDLKYCDTGTLWKDYRQQIQYMMPGLLEKLLVQRTVSGGYHFIFRCKKIEGNQKLARRPANEEEQKKGEKQKVLIETREQGGYILAPPSKGYEFIHNTIDNIPELTVVERETLLNAARYFDQVAEKPKLPEITHKSDGLSPFKDYNERGDALGLLISHGWRQMHTHGENIHLRRPGKEDAGASATYHKGNKWLYVFSTSTEFDAPQHHLPAAIFTKLECNDDWSEAARRLKEMGYGEQPEIKPNVEDVPVEKEDYSFKASITVMDKWLDDVLAGNQKMGLKTRFPILNEYYLYKENSFDVINGHDNVGKTVMLICLALDSAVQHGWKWIIWPSENRPGFIRQKLIELFMKRPIKTLTKDEMRLAKAFIDEHFTLLDNKEIYTHDQILSIGQRCFREKNYNGFLIDPYNALSVDMKGYPKLSTHEYHYEITTKMRQFASEYCAVRLNCHAVTYALRAKDGEYPKAPHKADTEGGGKFSNRADNFLTIHRITQHPTDWMVTEIHVRKIKETESGGKPTKIDDPVKLRMTNNKCDYVEYVEGDHGENDPQTIYNPDQHIEPMQITDVPF